MQPQFITLPYRAKNIAGQRFGRLVALGPVGHSSTERILWLCQCDCGKTAIVPGTYLRIFQTQSCGCFAVDRQRESHVTHGLTRGPLYDTWQGMVGRCTKPSNVGYAGYGGRGITICDEWRHDFKAFYDHAMQLPHCLEQGYSLDRIDNSLGYFPGNVRWATPTEQNRNRRDNILITYMGRTQCLQAWASEVGIGEGTLRYRLKAGWAVERVLMQPSRGRRLKGQKAP